TAVDDQQLAVHFKDGHVAANFTNAAQGDDPQGAVRQLGRGPQSWLGHLGHGYSSIPASARSALVMAISVSPGSTRGSRTTELDRIPCHLRICLTATAPWMWPMVARMTGSSSKWMRRAA